MKRVEIFCNQSIAEDLEERLEEAGLHRAVTRWTPVFGTGNSGPKEGSSVWPETNSAYLLFLKKKDLDKLRETILSIKADYPEEGLKCFISAGPEESI